jgi:type I restriction enzyme R subunit
VLVEAGYSAEARERAGTVVTSFRKFIEDHQDDIRALQVLYSRPYKDRLTYRDIKELANTLSRPPQHWTPERLWQAYDALDHSKVRGAGQRMLTDVVSLVQYALEQENELVPFRDRVEERFAAWLAMQEQSGTRFTDEQRRWLGWMKDHIAAAMAIDASAFELPPFMGHGGVGRAHAVFGDELQPLMDDLVEVLVA